MFIRVTRKENLEMNKILFTWLVLMIPLSLWSQSFRKSEIKPFIDFEQGHYDAVIDSLNKLTYTSTKPEFNLLKAKALYQSNNFQEALDLCQKLDRIKPGFASALKLRIYLSQENEKEAREALIANLNSYYKIPLYELLDAEEYASIYSMNLHELILVGNYYSQIEKQLYQLKRYIETENNLQALFLANEIISANWETSEAHHMKSIALLHQKDLAGALQAINSAILIKKSNAAYYTQRVEIYSELKKYELALEDINKMIRLDSYEIDHYIQKADLLFQAGYFEDAKEMTSAILELKPHDPDILYLSGKSSYMNKNYLQALKQINHAFEQKTEKEYFELRGDIYSATSTYEYAIKDYSMYLDIYPRSGEVYAKKGWARFQVGDLKGACSDWEKGKRYGSYDALQYFDKYCTSQKP